MNPDGTAMPPAGFVWGRPHSTVMLMLGDCRFGCGLCLENALKDNVVSGRYGFFDLPKCAHPSHPVATPKMKMLPAITT